MRKIFEYELQITDSQTIQMPIGAVILSAQFRNGRLCIWAIVDPGELQESRYFEIIGTGSPFDYTYKGDGLKYISTVQQHSGKLIWHVFESLPIFSNPLT